MPSKASMRSSSRSSSSSKSSSSSNVMWVIIGLLVVAILLIVFMSNRKFFEGFANEGTPVLQYFYMDSCIHCNNFTQNVWNDFETEVKSNPDKYKCSVAKYNLNDQGEGRELSEKYKITSAPTLILLMPDGTTWTEYKGDRSKDDLLRFINQKTNN
jgi:thioredoxin-related protein